MSDLSDYQITFRRNPLLGSWSWSAITPDGRTLTQLAIWGFMEKENAEADALRRIQADSETESVSGSDLIERVSGARREQAS